MCSCQKNTNSPDERMLFPGGCTKKVAIMVWFKALRKAHFEIGIKDSFNDEGFPFVWISHCIK